MTGGGGEEGAGGGGPHPPKPKALQNDAAARVAAAAHRAVRGGGGSGGGGGGGGPGWGGGGGGGEGGNLNHGTPMNNPHQGDDVMRGSNNATDRASRVAEAARRAEPLLDMKQRTTHDDPNFMGTFYKASRLHYIGTWKHRYEAFLEELPPAPPLPPPDRSLRGGERLIMHVDMDCFFAAVAALGRPELADLPVAVSWSSAGAGELSSCNYAARARGCRAGMRIASAKELCPNLVVMPYEFERYSAVALDVYAILHDVTPHVMGVSVDEAYVDVTHVPETPEEIAAMIRIRISEKTGCVASVGSGPNRLIARLATKKAKPDGAHHVSASAAASFIAVLPADDLPGVGRGTMDKLKKVSAAGGGENRAVLTCADIVATPLSLLQRALGPKSGAALLDAAKGVDRRAWEARPPRRSVGAQVTWGVRFKEASEAVEFVEKLAAEVSERMRRLKTKGRTLTLKILRAVANAPSNYMKGSIGHGVCDHLTRSFTLSNATDAAKALQREAVRLLADLNVPADEIRGVGVQVSKLDGDPAAARARGGSSGRQLSVKSAPAGKRSEWVDRANTQRYAWWFDDDVKNKNKIKNKDTTTTTATVNNDVVDNSARGGGGGGGRGGVGGHNYAGALSDRSDSGTLQAALARGGLAMEAGDSPDCGGGENKRAKARRTSLEQKSPAAADADAAEMEEVGDPHPTTRSAPSSSIVESELDADEEEEGKEENVDDEEEEEGKEEIIIMRAYQTAARVHAWEQRRRQLQVQPPRYVVDEGQARSPQPASAEEVVVVEEVQCDAARLLSGAEAFLLDAAGDRFASEGPESAAALVDFARGLASAQENLPPWVASLTSSSGATNTATTATTTTGGGGAREGGGGVSSTGYTVGKQSEEEEEEEAPSQSVGALRVTVWKTTSSPLSTLSRTNE